MSNTGKPKSKRASAGPFAAVRWRALARSVGVAADEPIVIALSGGADSVYLLHVVAAAEPRPRVLAVHVDHGLRGEESERDARFAGRLCDELSIPFRRIAARVEDGPDLEARAREARYAALCRVAREAEIGVIATGHHADDALETLLLRMVRGTSIAGLAGLEKRVVVSRSMTSRPSERVASGGEIVVVRPLITLRREEVRRTLELEEIAWVEDGSNASERFTRNRVRHELLPRIAEIGGEAAFSNLRAFGAAIEELEQSCAALTADLNWDPPVHAAARRGTADLSAGGTLPRSSLMKLSRPLLARALWRLLTEGIGAAPSRGELERIVDDIALGRTGFHGLPLGFSLQLRSDSILLEPPPPAREKPSARHRPAPPALFDANAEDADRVLAVPGSVALADGRTIEARLLEVGARAPISRSQFVVELDFDLLARPLRVRFPRAGDRFTGLGAPGSKALTRFLADAGVPRSSRSAVPLVTAGEEIAWVVGIRPAARPCVSDRTTRRLVLSLVHAGLESSSAPHRTRAPVLPFDER